MDAFFRVRPSLRCCAGDAVRNVCCTGTVKIKTAQVEGRGHSNRTSSAKRERDRNLISFEIEHPSTAKSRSWILVISTVTVDLVFDDRGYRPAARLVDSEILGAARRRW